MADIKLLIDNEILNKIKMFADKKGQNENDFLNELIENALNNHHLVQTGGFVLTVPNPQYYHIDKENALVCISGLYEISKTCTNANIPNGLTAYADFLKTRLFADTQERKDYFESNLEMRTSAKSTQSDK